jgi:hypothetical protein
MSDYSILVCSFIVNKSYCSSCIVFFLCLLERVTRHTLREQRIQQVANPITCVPLCCLTVAYILKENEYHILWKAAGGLKGIRMAGWGG